MKINKNKAKKRLGIICSLKLIIIGISHVRILLMQKLIIVLINTIALLTRVIFRTEIRS